MDLGIVVGYVVSYLSGKAKKLADRAVNELLERLYAKVASNLRGDAALRRLEENPSDDQAQADLVDSLSRLTASSDALSRELAEIVAELADRDAQRLIIDAPVQGQVFQQVSADRGSVVGTIGRDVNIFQESDEDAAWRRAHPATKTVAVLGMLLAVAGMGIFFLTFFAHNPQPGDPDFMEMPAGFPVAFGVFFAGFVLMGISSIVVKLRRPD